MNRSPCRKPLHKENKMRAATRIALATLLVLASASEVVAQSRNRAHRGAAPSAQYQQRTPATKPAVLPFTAEEKGWFDRASRVY
jgi:hypothetical protein